MMIFVSFPIEKTIIPKLTVPSFSHFTYCTPAKPNLFLANSLAAATSRVLSIFNNINSCIRRKSFVLLNPLSEQYCVVVYSQEVPKLKFIFFRFSGTIYMLCLNCEERKMLGKVQFIIGMYE